MCFIFSTDGSEIGDRVSFTCSIDDRTFSHPPSQLHLNSGSEIGDRVSFTCSIDDRTFSHPPSQLHLNPNSATSNHLPMYKTYYNSKVLPYPTFLTVSDPRPLHTFLDPRIHLNPVIGGIQAVKMLTLKLPLTCSALITESSPISHFSSATKSPIIAWILGKNKLSPTNLHKVSLFPALGLHLSN